MSQQLKTPDQQLNAESQQTETQQKKIDPVAQLNWINNQKVDQGWGIFDNNQPAQLSTQEGELKQIESEEENQISAGEALHNDIDNAIQARFGTPVIQKETEEKEPAGENTESATSYLDSVELTNDDNLYTAFYNDITIYSTPESEASESVLEVGKKYKVINKCKVGENNFYQVKKDGEENSVGWIKDFEYVLYAKDITDREDKLKKFKEWLEERLTEVEAKKGDDKIKFVQGILGLIEKESANIAKDPPVYPNVDNLNKTPSYSETDNPDLNVAVPHELISITRKFINITELTPVAEAAETATTETATTETTVVETVTGGSRHSSNDWNTRLGAPQYRTQSDNMSIPEATCNVTTMAMTLERLGNSRSDVIATIDTKLKNGEEKTDAELKTLWEEKSKAYLEKITSVAGSGYQKLRGNNGGLVGKEGDLSKKFKEIAQLEDLLDFYMYLKTSDLSKRKNIFSTYKDSIPEDINSASEDKYNTERIDLNNSKRFNSEHRNKIKKTLDKGGSAVLSVFHKGNEDGSHIISIQSINSKGIIVDDPYGSHATDYRKGSLGDLFKGKDKDSSVKRSDPGLDFKNVSHYNINETDYTKRDFTVEAGQNLEEDESRGDSFLLNYKMINESASEFINYIVLYEEK